MGKDPALQEVVRDLYFAIMATFDGTGAVKLIENSEGKTLALTIQLMAGPIPPQGPQPIVPPVPPNPGGPLQGLPGGSPLRPQVPKRP
jgi:hypothetical protein